jgi:hypothetical protein
MLLALAMRSTSRVPTASRSIATVQRAWFTMRLPRLATILQRCRLVVDWRKTSLLLLLQKHQRRAMTILPRRLLELRARGRVLGPMTLPVMPTRLCLKATALKPIFGALKAALSGSSVTYPWSSAPKRPPAWILSLWKVVRLQPPPPPVFRQRQPVDLSPIAIPASARRMVSITWMSALLSLWLVFRNWKSSTPARKLPFTTPNPDAVRTKAKWQHAGL